MQNIGYLISNKDTDWVRKERFRIRQRARGVGDQGFRVQGLTGTPPRPKNQKTSYGLPMGTLGESVVCVVLEIQAPH